jgi:orotate phosphoribosyltransferase
MEDYKREFIDFMMEVGVLTFGDFTTKSGRKTPYFVNTGLYRSGSQLERLGEFYANAIQASVGKEFDVLFGPAYKGIPLVVTTAMALSRRGHDAAFCFNRKEAKDHGEGGVLVGHKVTAGDRVLIIEDVTTAGTSIRETVPVLRAAAEVQLAGLVVSVDRGERGTGTKSALAEVGEEFEMPTFSIVNVHEIREHVDLAAEDDARMQAYLDQYGA